VFIISNHPNVALQADLRVCSNVVAVRAETWSAIMLMLLSDAVIDIVRQPVLEGVERLRSQVATSTRSGGVRANSTPPQW